MNEKWEKYLIDKYFPIAYGLYLIESKTFQKTKFEKFQLDTPFDIQQNLILVKEDFIKDILERWKEKNIHFIESDMSELKNIKLQEEWGLFLVHRATLFKDNVELQAAVKLAKDLLSKEENTIQKVLVNNKK